MILNNEFINIIENKESLYDGDLRYYLKIVLTKATNLNNPYHNFRHMMHVLFLAYQACKYYKEKLLKREIRNILVAAMFHDFDHTGKKINDKINIDLAIAGLHKYIDDSDKEYLSQIEDLIRSTEYPHKDESEYSSFGHDIIRDVDMAQALNTVWVQQVVFGLAQEQKVDYKEIFARQEQYLYNIKFHTDWARQQFSQKVIDDKIAEAKWYLDVINN
ncbi:MAG: hypothetical protein WCF94_00900 [bacterium]